MINGDGDKSGHEFGSRHYVDQNSEQTLFEKDVKRRHKRELISQ